MLAENLANWAQEERQAGRLEGRQEGRQEGIVTTARNLLTLGALSDDQIAVATGLTVEEIAKLRNESTH